MDFKELINDYLEDADSHIAVFDGALLSMERGFVNEDIIRRTLGALHTLKGNSGMMGYTSVKDYVHQIEDVLKKVNEGEREFQAVKDSLFESANVLRTALKAMERDSECKPDLSNDLLRLKAAVNGWSVNGGAAPRVSVEDESAKESSEGMESGETAQNEITDNSGVSGAEGQEPQTFSEGEETGPVDQAARTDNEKTHVAETDIIDNIVDEAADGPVDGWEAEDSLRVIPDDSSGMEEPAVGMALEEGLSKPGEPPPPVEPVSVTTGVSGTGGPGGFALSPAEQKASTCVSTASTMELSTYLGTRTDTIKVDFKRLDNLMELVGELVIFKTRLSQFSSKKRELVLDRKQTKDFNDVLETTGRTISNLQEGVMRSRMMPVSHVFGKFPRMVRDLARACGKEVRVEFSGEETELDKTVIDELAEPLLHIVRNSVDHGIESPAERRAEGKSPEGVISLTALQESNYVIIRVSDDGGGIDLERTRQKAVSKGLLNEHDIVDRETLYECLFAAGFSTREVSTDVSGRGIGLDVVSRNIAKLNGQISISSTHKRGTSFTIKLPLSLAIIPALMAEVSDEVFAIPINSVDRTFSATQSDIHIVNNREVIRQRERILPVIRLSEHFELKSQSREGRFYMVVAGKAEKRVALAVDRLIGRQEIVIKPLDEIFGRFKGLAGASILGNGKIVLIVDVMPFCEKRRFNGEKKS